jgi:hypothetical protein
MKLSIIPLSLAFASTAGAFVTAPNIKSVSTTKLEAFKGWQVATAVAGWGLAAQLACAVPTQLVAPGECGESDVTGLLFR